MGVGYQVSALSRISYIDPPRPGEIQTLTQWNFKSTPAPVITEWRSRIERKYEKHLGEPLNWDETDEFEWGVDITTGDDVLIRYAAAVLDLRGVSEARSLAVAMKPSYEIINKAFEDIERRGFSGRFPQLGLGANYWFPFERDLIIDEPNWRGLRARYGSSFRLAKEIEEIRAFISDASPESTKFSEYNAADGEVSVLTAAWRASETIHKGCMRVSQHRLPLWTTG
jgi:hypothetical protein